MKIIINISTFFTLSSDKFDRNLSLVLFCSKLEFSVEILKSKVFHKGNCETWFYHDYEWLDEYQYGKFATKCIYYINDVFSNNEHSIHNHSRQTIT